MVINAASREPEVLPRKAKAPDSIAGPVRPVLPGLQADITTSVTDSGDERDS